MESVPAMSGWDRLFRLKRAEAVLPSWHGEFDVTPIVCGNPSCTCEEVTLAFRESAAPRGAAALAFDVAVDLAVDAPASAQGLGARATQLGEGVARGLTGAVRAEVRAALREHRRRQGRVREAVAEYVRRGQSVPYAHVLVGGQPDDEDLHDVLEVIDLSGEDWEVVDLICARRECRCAEVALDFVTFREEDQLGFRVRVPLGGGAATFEELSGVTPEQARSVFAEWERETTYDRTELRRRYDLLRTMSPSAAVNATVKPAAPSGRPVRVAAEPVGRREPCPCGSGKRYKNCCGARG